MNPSSPKNTKKNNIILAAIGIVALLAMFYFFGSAAPESETLDTTAPIASADAARILNLLTQIQSLRIDTAIFDATAYQTLVDYSVAIPEVPVGRPNPFAPLPGVSTAP